MKNNGFNERVRLNGGIDRIINDWKIIDIHLIPEKFGVHSEVDFYCCYKEEFYLLRIRKRKENKFSIIDRESPTKPIYLVAEYDFEKFDEIILKEILEKFENEIKINCT
ncbi:hypothetical protein PG275_09080 [Riemerella anatipestifer]|nr:hypothetical protein [Riemerella anatipestifer]